MKRIYKSFDRYQIIGVALLGFALASLRFWQFFLGKTIYFGDNYSLLVPGKVFTASWMKEGIFPLWNPYIFGGISWLGDTTQSITYFSTFFFVWLQPAIALNTTIIIHYVITAVGMWLLANKFVKEKWQAILAVILWVFSTQLAGATNNISTLQSLAWLPWMVYLGFLVQKGWRGRFLFAAVVLLQFLGGYPQHVIYTIFFAVLISFYDLLGKKKWHSDFFSWLVSWSKTAVLSVILSAVAWVPFVESFISSTRITQSLEQAQVGSLHPGMLLKPFLPYIFDMQMVGMKWGPAWSGQPNVVFVITGFGMLVILASLLKWRKLDRWIMFFAIFTAISLFFSLGKFIPNFALIQQMIPLFRVGRYPSMVMILTNISVILWFISYLPKFKLSVKWHKILITLLTISAMLAAIGLGMAWMKMEMFWSLLNVATNFKLEHSIFHNIARDQVIILVITANLLWVSLLTIVNLISWRKRNITALLIFITIEMWLATQGMFFFASNDVYPTWEQIHNHNQQYSMVFPDYRMLTRNSNKPYTDYGSYWEALVVRAPFSDSFVDREELEGHANLKRIQIGLTPDWNMAYGVPVINGYTTLLPQDFAAIWQTTEESRINFVDFIDIEDPALQDWAVKYYLVDDWYPDIPDLSELPVVQSEGHLTLYEMPGALSRFRYSDGSPIELNNFEETPNQISLTFDASVASQIIIADRFDSNWQATLNGERVEIENVDGMRGVLIDQGHNTLMLEYVPTYFYLGLLVSLAALAIGGILVWKFDKS